MPRIFMSYRRADSRKDAGRIYDRLVEAFGRENIFKDLDNIPLGVDFRQVLVQAVGHSDVMLVIIGQRWLEVKDEGGSRRLDNAEDFVRVEIESGLERKKCLVVPLLVDNAAMPSQEELPPTLRKLAFRNALEVRDDPDFHGDVSRLIKGLQQRFGVSHPTGMLSGVRLPTYDVHAAIGQFYKAFDEHEWDSARALLAEIRASGKAPRVFDADGHEKELWSAIENEEAEKEYEVLRMMAKRERPAKLWEGLQMFWTVHPGYDPDNLARFQPLTLEWIHIPGGQVTLETGKVHAIADFEIARHPVTNAQFEVFIEAADGYRDSKWWGFSDEALRWRRQNPRPQKTGYEGDRCPRTNITWFEAMAFCRWLTAKGVLSPNPSPLHGERRRGEDEKEWDWSEAEAKAITLPTEQQWQRAAQGDTGWLYPWGDEFDPARCNFNSGGPTPVTQYPTGATPHGVLDMSGNVWEWCLTDYELGLADPAKSAKYRVMRGGSWKFDLPDLLRVTVRRAVLPTDWDDAGGFRCVRI